MVNLTKALARELGRDGITVNAIHPYTTVTRNLPPRLAQDRFRCLRAHRPLNQASFR